MHIWLITDKITGKPEYEILFQTRKDARKFLGNSPVRVFCRVSRFVRVGDLHSIIQAMKEGNHS